MHQQYVIIALAAVLAVYGLRDIVRLYKLRRRRQIISDTPTSKIGEVREGFVELKGRVYPVKTQVSPLSGERCVFWRYEIQERRFSARSGSRWETIRADESEEDFLLQDESGAALVKVQGADIELAIDRVEESKSGGTVSPATKMFFASIGFNPEREKKGVRVSGQPPAGTAEPSGGPQRETSAAAVSVGGSLSQQTTSETATSLDGGVEDAGQAGRPLLRIVEYYLAPGDGVYLHGFARPAQPFQPAQLTQSEPCGVGGITPRIVVLADPKAPAFFISDRPEPQILFDLEEQSRALLLWLIAVYGLSMLLVAVGAIR